MHLSILKTMPVFWPFFPPPPLHYASFQAFPAHSPPPILLLDSLSFFFFFSSLDASGRLWLLSHTTIKPPASAASLPSSLLKPVMKGMPSILLINKRGAPGPKPDWVF